MNSYRYFVGLIISLFCIFAVSGTLLFVNANSQYMASDAALDFAFGNHSSDDPDNPDVSSDDNLLDGRGSSYNVLFLVPDVASGCTDTIIIINYNPSLGTFKTLSIPRDTYVVSDGIIGRINEIYATHGINGLSQAIYDTAGITLNYYVSFKIDTLKYIIDMFGGVWFDLPVDLYYSDPTQDLYIDLQAGYQLFDGNMSEQLLRFRQYSRGYHASEEQLSYYDGRDMNRVQTQIKFITAFVDQNLNFSGLTKMNSMISYILDQTKTNIQSDVALEIFYKFQKNYTQSDISPIHSFYLEGVEGLKTRSNGAQFYASVPTGNFIDASTKESFLSTDIVKKYFTTQRDMIK